MAKAIYDGKRLIPITQLSVNKEYQTSPDGEKVGSIFVLNITGTIFAYKGSPDSTGAFYTGGGFYEPDGRSQPTYNENIGENSRFAAIIKKQQAIRGLFANEGRQLEFQPFDASAPMKCNPRNFKITFQDNSQWYDTCDYTISCECDVLYVDGAAAGEDAFAQYISNATENWSIETSEEPEDESKPKTYRLTHTVSATGKRFYNADGTLAAPAWKQARDWALPKLGIDAAFINSSGVADLPSYYGGYNHLRSENIDENGGNYSVTETWVLASGTALEDFTINTRNSLADGIVSVSVEGNIRGLEQRDSNMNLTVSKWDNASAKFSFASGVALSRAQTYSGYSLNVEPLSIIVGKNPVAGTISYSMEYDNRPSNLLTGSKSEVISISDSFDIDVFAAIPILGRTAGPILQNIATHRELSRTLSIEVVFGADYANGTIAQRLNSFNPRFKEPTKTELQEIVNAAHPVLAGLSNNAGIVASQAFVADQNMNWEPNNGRMSYTVTWVWE